MRKKNLSDNQQEIIETYLPEELFKSKKIDDGMKLVLANIYRFYMYDKNIGKKSIFRTNRSFMRDIEAKDPNELHRPLTRLIMRGFITRKTGNSDERIACEYTLMPQFYEMLPDCFKTDFIEVSDNFENSKVTTGTGTDTDADKDIKTTTGVVDQMVPGPEKEKVEMKSNDIDMVLGRETTRKMHSPSPSFFSSSPSSNRSTTEGDGDWLNSTMNRIFNEKEPVNASTKSSWREHERLVNATGEEDLPF